MNFLKAMIGRVGEEKLFIASDDVEDRQGEVIVQEGWDLVDFKNNPVIQWAHNPNEPAIATAEKIGFKEIDGKKKLVYSPVFHRKTPMSNYIADLVEAGVIKASSVGFKPIEMDGNKYTKAQLLEISFVNVPANQNALSLGLSKGYSMDVIKAVMPDIKEEEVKEVEKTILETTQKNLESKEEESKGMVADEIAIEEMMAKKYAKMEQFWNAIYAFCDVYYKEETTPDQFETLLKELAGIMTNMADGIMEEAEEKTINIIAIDRAEISKFITTQKEEMIIEEKKVAEGDACTMEDGTDGTMQMNEDGEMECIKKPKKAEATEEEKTLTERVEDIESTLLGLSDGFKKMDAEITEKFASIEVRAEEQIIINDDIKTYLASQSTVEKPEEKGALGREPKTAVESQEDKNRRLAMKALNRVVEILNKTK